MAKLVRTIPPLPLTDRGSSCQFALDAPGERIIYCNGPNVIWRNVAPLLAGGAAETPEDIFVWDGHSKRTTCVAMSPNSQWLVSGDVSGAIRVWGAKGDHVLKNEYKLWDGTVKDVQWSGDSTRIVAAGDGKQMQACAMIWDTGSKTGEVSGHTKQVNSISFRSQRPFRVVTGGEDNLVAFHEGPPFKFARSHTTHSNFVNCVRFSLDGEFSFSAGADSKLCVYDGKSGELVKEFEKPAGITGSLWEAAWSPDSTLIVTAGGDKKLRVWNRDSGKQVCEVAVGTGILEDMQVGVAWPAANRIVSTCLDGRLLLWDVGADGAATLAVTIDGIAGPLACIACDAKSGTLAYGGADGTVCISPQGQPTRKARVGTKVHCIVGHSSTFGGPAEVWAASLDNCIRRISLETGEVIGTPAEIKEFVVGAGWLDAGEEKLVVATSKNAIHCVGASGIEWSKPGALPRKPTALATSPGTPCRCAIAIEKPDGSTGGVQSTQFDILLYNIADPAALDGTEARLCSEEIVLSEHRADVTAMRFSPSGEFLASCDAANKVYVWNLLADTPVVLHSFANHTARVACLDWLPCGRRLVSGSLDQHVFVWNMDEPLKKVDIAAAHRGGVAGVTSCGAGAFASVGFDGFVRCRQLE